MQINSLEQIQKHLLKKYNKVALDKKEFANEIGVSISTVDNYLKKNEKVAKYVKLGTTKNAKVVFPIVEVAKFLSETVEVDNG